MNISEKDNLVLESLFVSDFQSRKKFESLSEAQKINLNRESVNVMLKNAAQKAAGLDYGDIPNTKGDFTKIKNYKNFVGSLEGLNKLKRTNTELEELDIINQAHKNLLLNTENFKNGYKYDSDGIKMFYENICVALIMSTSYVISTYLQYVKNIDGSYTIYLEKTKSSSVGLSTYMLKLLKKFNEMQQNGKLDVFFRKMLSKRELKNIEMEYLGNKDKIDPSDDELKSESWIASITSVVSAITSGVSTPVVVAAGSIAAIVAIVLIIVPLIRFGIYQFYNCKIRLKGYLDTQAAFLELNKSKLNPSTDKETIKKQEKVIQKLRSMSEKITVDQVSSSKKTDLEIKKENQDFRDELNDSYATNDILF